jgi:DNA-binding transcriptional MerR regulator
VLTDTVQAKSARLRIDELAHRSGIASGTIRFYQREGLIDPPEREGRVAYYDPSHVERLGRIRALQAHGLPLALIRDLLAREDAGHDISAWLALDSAVFGKRHTVDPVDERTLTRLGLEADDIAALARAGVFRRQGGALTALPGMLELMARLLDAGVEAATLRVGAELIATRLRGVADSIAALGWEVFAADRERLLAADPGAAADVLAKLEHLRSLALRIVETQFPLLLDEAVRERSEAFALEVAGGRRQGQPHVGRTET